MVRLTFPDFQMHLQDAIDMGAISYGNQLKRDGSTFYGTHFSRTCSLFIRLCIFVFFVWACIEFSKGKYLVTTSDLKSRPSGSMPGVFDKLSFRVKVGTSTRAVYILSIGASFEEESEYTTFSSNCANIFHNLPAELSFFNDLASFQKDSYGTESKCNYDSESGDNTVATVYFLDPTCSSSITEPAAFELFMDSYTPSPNEDGYSKITRLFSWNSISGKLHQITFDISSLHIKRNSKWYPFKGKENHDYLFHDLAEAQTYDMSDFLENYGGSAYTTTFPRMCGIRAKIDMSNITHTQEIWPQSLFSFIAFLGGFLSVVMLLKVLLQFHNRWRFSADISAPQIDEIERFLETTQLEFALMNQTNKRVDKIEGRQKVSAPNADEFTQNGQVKYNDMEWLPAKIYDDGKEIHAIIEGNLTIPEAKGEIVTNLKREHVRMTPVSTFSGAMRPKTALGEAFMTSKKSAVRVEVFDLIGDSGRRFNGKRGVARSYKAETGRWIVNIEGNEYEISEANLKVDSGWIDVELELLPDGHFQAREVLTNKIHKVLAPGDVRVHSPLEQSLTIHAQARRKRDLSIKSRGDMKI